ncbi:MAG: alpha/beta hydrolase, partial [Pseudomonadota bacterium]
RVSRNRHVVTAGIVGLKMREDTLAVDDGAELRIRSWMPVAQHPGRPVLLLHSLFFDGSMFDQVAVSLCRNRRVLVPDHRGQGESTPGTRPATAERLAADMLHLRDAYDLGPVHLVGSSMGAYVAFEILAADPQCAVSLTVSCCTCREEADPNRFDALARKIAEADGKGLGDTLMPLMFGKSFLSDPSAAAQSEYWRARFDDLPDGTDRVVAAIFSHRGWVDLLRDWGRPILALSGGEDTAKSPSDLEWISEESLGRFELFPRSGHTLPLEEPRAYVSALEGFFGDVERNPDLCRNQPTRQT